MEELKNILQVWQKKGELEGNELVLKDEFEPDEYRLVERNDGTYSIVVYHKNYMKWALAGVDPDILGAPQLLGGKMRM